MPKVKYVGWFIDVGEVILLGWGFFMFITRTSDPTLPIYLFNQ